MYRHTLTFDQLNLAPTIFTNSENNCVHLRETVIEYIQNEKRGDFICLW